jgi:hypothetical protein
VVSVELNTESNAEARKEETIRQRAYEIWLSEGCPEGRENEHWEQAAREVEGALGEPLDHAESPASTAGQDKAEASAPYSAGSLAA